MNITKEDIINKFKEIEPEYFNDFKFNYAILYEGSIVKATPEFFASLALKDLKTHSYKIKNANNTNDGLIAIGMFFTYLYTIKGKMALDITDFPKFTVRDSVSTYYFHPKPLGLIKYSINKIFSDDYIDACNFTIYCEIDNFDDEYSLISVRYNYDWKELFSYANSYAAELKKQKDLKVSEYFKYYVSDEFSIGLEKIGPTPFKPGESCCLCAGPVSASNINEYTLSDAFYADSLVYKNYGPKFKSSKEDLKAFKLTTQLINLGVKIFED